MSQTTAGPLVVYADYVCPFCFLGYESLNRYQESRATPVAVEWHPYDLRSRQRDSDGEIDPSVDNGKDEEYYENARRNVERLADQYDVEMGQSLDRSVDSFDTQRVAYAAADDHPETFEAFHRGVFDALWRDGRDIGDPAVLEELAIDAGLPDGYVTETLEDDDTHEALESAFAAAQSRRITGVPTFLYGEHAARGAVPPDHLRRLVEGE